MPASYRHPSRCVGGAAAAVLLSAAVLFAVPATPAAAGAVDGNARFAVLTPTLIRVEYAGDGV